MTSLDNFCLYWDFAVKLKADLSNNLSLDKNYKLFGKQPKSLLIDAVYDVSVLHSVC